MPPLESNEEEKKGTGLKILTPNKLLTRLPILLLHIEAGSNSSKLKNELRQILPCISIIKPLKKFTAI